MAKVRKETLKSAVLLLKAGFAAPYHYGYDSTVNQLVSSLRVYIDRGEFNPDSETALQDAKKCLEQARYEFTRFK